MAGPLMGLAADEGLRSGLQDGAKAPLLPGRVLQHLPWRF